MLWKKLDFLKMLHSTNTWVPVRSVWLFFHENLTLLVPVMITLHTYKIYIDNI